MDDVLTYGIELAVGLACLLAGAVALTKALRWFGFVLLVAGLAAATHAVVRLVD